VPFVSRSRTSASRGFGDPPSVRKVENMLYMQSASIRVVVPVVVVVPV
jgi:hypothetical protein